MEDRILRNATAACLSAGAAKVIAIIQDFIKTERSRNFAFLGQHTRTYEDSKSLLLVSIADSEDSSQLENISTPPSPQTSYYLTFREPLCANRKRTVRVHILPLHTEELTVESLAVFDPKSDLSQSDSDLALLSTWMRHHYEWHDLWEMKFSQVQYEEQRLWWDQNGKIFKFLALSAEIRDLIYGECVGTVIVPELGRSSSGARCVTFGRGLQYQPNKRPGTNRDPDIDPPKLNLSLVNKQVHRELTMVAYRDTIKRFCWFNKPSTRGSQSSFPTLLRSICSLSPHKYFLRDIQLEMCASKYMNFIGITPRAPHSPFGLTDPLNVDQSPINELFAFRELRRLDLRFISPNHPNATCPWKSSMPNNSNLIHSCQKVWIDRFLTLAWSKLNYLRMRQEYSGHRFRITLSGCIKDSMRKSWEGILNDKQHDYSHDVKARRIRIKRAKHDALPFTCRCSKPCVSAPLLDDAFDEYERRTIEGLQEELDLSYWDYND